jgi:hypothetical protein
MFLKFINKIKNLFRNIISLIRLLRIIKQNELKEKKQIVILAPFFFEENMHDGYLQRVKAIDDNVFNAYFRLYLQGGIKGRKTPNILFIDKDHAVYSYDSFNWIHQKITLFIIKKCGAIYCHSIFRIMPDEMAPKMLQKLFSHNIQFIIDMHGAVPEELAFQGDFVNSKIADQAERFIMYHADIIITVTETMKSHLINKYGNINTRFIVLPIFPWDFESASDFNEKPTLREAEKPIIVYAGGLQKWQNIQLMKELIAKSENRFQYFIFVPNPVTFNKKIEEIANSTNIRIEQLNHKQIYDEYKYCRYGFALRDDNIINHVACPTKIIEYLSHGIIPIVKSPNIGDLPSLHFSYIKVDDFLINNLPDENERIMMANNNRFIIKKFYKKYTDGIYTLLSNLKY